MGDLTRFLVLLSIGRHLCTYAETLRAPATLPNMLLTTLPTLARPIFPTSCTTIHVLHVATDNVCTAFLGTAGTNPSSLLLAVGSPDTKEATDANTADVLLKSRTAAVLAT